ncbi:unannotated protein [freshwater metagenome]|uniref:Unannotated protein n=1 Tax=freshwater metagenome TaxID=449393 RepID=A0A6J7FHV4_9ZZZZ|nr:bifunctional phosphopantothenoylcysteine decarboxylase/phosphopantothenate--cysteine ligase CoaBC [Actinomycetota bacterium]MSW98864.1 bifunctional phosphopantothenoylcysteine decarboxylase/phosphopantothenate--cysteine ligase CoaBC [Actinomycetota bacterium]MSY82088.1 bifunctional phosphopantothenoylcysteine decarboxylase/phosphopantothenate--cysteine ligase CoaBC [Actinomycetota bacterium]MSZ46025.1 bifunctional phosphopantothenoylcysteine decarboxylase/phosphopantothenate--cysteine ligase 
MPPRGRELILGVGGGIAAYKSADLLRRLQDHGFLITVVPTRASLNFVGKATWEALSGREVHEDLWKNVSSVPHISLARSADAIVIAPATADLIAKIATGRADDLLTNIVSASASPIILVPAMHPEMWLNPATIENVKILRSRGLLVIDPDEGRLTGADSGPGRFPTSERIVHEVEDFLGSKADLQGVTVLVSAGGTREPIDAVRYLGNLSSGKQGYALAYAAAKRGARVLLVAANCEQPDIEGVTTIHVKTAAEMLEALSANFASAQVLIMSAAVADFRPSISSDQKIDKSELASLTLIENPDILKTLTARRLQGQVIIGFAAQTGEGGSEKAMAKLKAKGLDAIYVNDVSGGAIFGEELTNGSILDSDGTISTVATTSKDSLAHLLLDVARNKLG